MQQQYTDQEIQSLFRQDTEKAIEALFQLYYVYLCQAAFRIVTDSQLAEDLTQEVFFELWRKKEGIAFTISIKAYLRRAVVNKALNYIRDRKKITDDEDKMLKVESTAPSATQLLDSEELQQLIDRSIDELPEKCRLVFVLSRFEEMSYQEIADHLGISIKTVENQIVKALKHMRIALQPWMET
ncbi:MAG: RNA polymerase sigma-70 factor [Saprospiraceae bacterium]